MAKQRKTDPLSNFKRGYRSKNIGKSTTDYIKRKEQKKKEELGIVEKPKKKTQAQKNREAFVRGFSGTHNIKSAAVSRSKQIQKDKERELKAAQREADKQQRLAERKAQRASQRLSDKQRKERAAENLRQRHFRENERLRGQREIKAIKKSDPELINPTRRRMVDILTKAIEQSKSRNLEEREKGLKILEVAGESKTAQTRQNEIFKREVNIISAAEDDEMITGAFSGFTASRAIIASFYSATERLWHGLPIEQRNKAIQLQVGSNDMESIVKATIVAIAEGGKLYDYIDSPDLNRLYREAIINLQLQKQYKSSLEIEYTDDAGFYDENEPEADYQTSPPYASAYSVV